MIDHNGVEDTALNAHPEPPPRRPAPDVTATMTKEERAKLPPPPPVPPRWFDPASGTWTEKRPKSRRIASDADGTPWTFALKPGEGGRKQQPMREANGPEQWYRATLEN